MKRILTFTALAVVVFAVAFAWSAAANAQDNWRVDCYHNRYVSGCAGRVIGPAPVPSDDEVAALEHEAHKWVEFCKPIREPDAEGVIHLRYAHPGCANGRSE